ncbi:PAS domain S-box protein [Flavobacterium sp.]|jgi:PAS domain S-box-containing protein|uniref:PAS domain S-box protein n=1 Tax=Flavobacterium sp. TaxID=239 RepID=UPI002A822B26|nr:PAS domain S-box protein [Flavobacterium sp.]
MKKTLAQEFNYTRSLIEASLDPLVTISAEGKITDVNEASIKVTGVSRDELINTNFSNYFTDPKKAQEGYLQVFEKGFVADYPLTIKHKNGNLTDVLYNASVYKDDNGNVLGVFAAARDVTFQKWAIDLRNANEELASQNKEIEKRAAELVIANKELLFQNEEKEKRAAELIIANEKARRVEHELKNARKIAQLGSWYLDLKTNQASWSEELFNIYGYDPLLPAPPYNEQEKLFSTASWNVLTTAIKNTIETGIPYELELEIIRKDGSKGWLWVLGETVLNKDNETDGLWGAAQDITSRKESEIELLFQNEEKEKRAAELVIANKELAYQNKVIEKREAELVIANKELAFQNTEKEKRAAELVIANEELAFQNIQKVKQELANKELEASNIDIKSDSLYSLSLIEASLDPLVTVSSKGKITDMNEALANVTGLTREELTDSDFLDYFTEPKKARDVYKEVFAKGSVTDFPLTLRHKSGKLTDVLFNGSTYKDEKGNVEGVVIVARDVTEQKKAARELTEAMLFAEMATMLAEEAKIKAEKSTLIAEDAVKAKQQFLSNMSHEIRTPMNAIIGFTKVVLKTDLTAKQKEYLRAIKVSGDALIVLINDILDLAKVDAGKMAFEQTPFKMSSSISAMLHLFEPKIQEKNLKLVKIYDEKIPDVLVGDPVRLHQVILNLVSNAVKFTSKGKITVDVKLVDEDENKVTIEFSVTDTGIGIPDSKIETIFDNFQQASSGTSRLYGGTGLGLAIVKQLIEPQGGSIQVTSKIDEGSTFSFKLSFLKTNAEVEMEIEMEDYDKDVSEIKILVVEDIPLNQLLMRTLLDDFGFECDIADNGRMAIDKMQDKSYDLILMDLQMPEMNGFEATDYIRNSMNSNIPIIALTADVTTVDLAKCKAVGMNDYIAKPVDERLLYSKMLSLIKKASIVEEPDVAVLEESVKIKCTDLHYLSTRTKSNRVLMMEMISLYLEQTPVLISAMKQSLLENDWKGLNAAVHKMIPSFSIVGIHTDYENMAKKIQEFANTMEKTEELSDLVLQLENICNQACSELLEDLNTYKNAKDE